MIGTLVVLNLSFSFRLLLYYLRLTINFLCDVPVLWIMLDYVDILSPVSLAECIIILISLCFPLSVLWAFADSTIHIPTILCLLS